MNVDAHDKEHSIGTQVALFEPNGSIQSLWLPGGVPQGHYVFDTPELDNFCIEAYDGQWFAVCSGDTTFANGGRENYMLLKDRQLRTIRTGSGLEYIIFVEEITEDRGVFNNYANPFDDEITIGRTPNNDIQYDLPFVSSSHAKLFRNKTVWKIQDTNSLNGTYVNGKKIQECELAIGDVIYIVGLKIIVGVNFLSINSCGRPVSLQLRKLVPLKETLQDYQVECTKKTDKYFDRQPRRRKALPQEPIVIDGAPMSMKGNKMPLLLRMGGSLVMGTTSMLAGHFTTMLSSVLFPMLSHKFTEKERKEYEERRVTAYTKYLLEKELEIFNKCNLEESVLNWNYPDIETVMTFPQDGKRLWERKKTDDDFLHVRVGHGDVKMLAELQYPQERFSIDEDEMEQKMRELVDKDHTIHDVPIQTSLMDDYIVGVSGVESLKIQFIKRFIMQLTILHSYDEVKIIILGDTTNWEELSDVRFLPHIWNDQRNFRFWATNPAEAYQISEYLKKELDEDLNNSHQRKDYLKRRPYYVVFALDKKIFESMEILKVILQEENIGVSIVALFEDLPKECSKIFQLNMADKHEIIYLKQLDAAVEKFQMDSFQPEVAGQNVKRLANTTLKVVTEAFSLPKSLSFLEMYGVGKIEHLNITKRWNDNNPVSSLAVPVGVATDGSLFNLDLHEKFQGPHGLIAGMTGSGKSEFIITYILSLAINFHPDEVSFILIDYKGGGLAGAFDDPRNGIHLPHLMGTITNLDGSAIQRSLVSIQSELTRRQRVFNEAKSLLNEGTMNIYDYQKMHRAGKVKEPMPHLFIISDEFAELKSQQPEFMNQLISAARIGRSLGVHLILATQKPSGVVNDQILSNTKFRVCLKVQDKSDSMEMLKRPEAAELRNIGSFYLQVGYNEFFALGQSAWTGAPYEPSDEVRKRLDDSLQFIDCVGQTIHSVKKEKKKVTTNKAELVEIVRTLSDIAKAEGIKEKSLWKPPLPKQLDLDELEPYCPKTSNISAKSIEICLGVLDDPMKQMQFPLLLNLQTCKNILIAGNTGSGKTTLLQSMLLSLVNRYSSSEIQYYALDYSSRMLKLFKDFPHCGEILGEDDEDKQIAFFDLISEIIQERKQIFAQLEVDNFDTARSIIEMPLILVIIDNFAGMVATKKGSDLQYKLQDYLKNSVNYGVQFVITCSHLNEVLSRVKQELGTRICLHMKDKYDYGEALGCKCSYEPPETAGRGMFNHQGEPLELQIAKFASQFEEKDRIKLLKDEIKKILSFRQREKIAKRLPHIPEEETFEQFAADIPPGRIPLGYSLQTAKKVSLPLKQFSMLSLYFGNSKSTIPVLSNFLKAFVMENMDIVIIKGIKNNYLEQSMNDLDIFSKCSVKVCPCEQPALEDMCNYLGLEIKPRRELLEEYCKDNNLNVKSIDIHKETYNFIRTKTKPMVILFENYTDFCLTATEEITKVFVQVFKVIQKYNMYAIGLFFKNEDITVRGRTLMKLFNPEQLVMMIGGEFDGQSIIPLPMQFANINDKNIYNYCLMRYDQQFYPMQLPIDYSMNDVYEEDDKNIFE